MRRLSSTSAYEAWTRGEIDRLLDLKDAGKSIDEIAAVLGRQPSAIPSRLDRETIRSTDHSHDR
jgi:hypothetical protein